MTALVVMPTLVGALVMGQWILVLTTVNRVLATLTMQISVTGNTIQTFIFVGDAFAS